MEPIMTMQEALECRHSVRSYTGQLIPQEVRDELRAAIDTCNSAGNLDIKLVCDEPVAFSGIREYYGRFTEVHDYLALVGPDEDGLEQRCGYYGQYLVLLAQTLGLNSCWVGGTYDKETCTKDLVGEGERLVLVVALGYGTTQGEKSPSKDAADICRVNEDLPDWFERGIDAALKAPTAMNQQSFRIAPVDLEAEPPVVKAVDEGGILSAVDLGIVKRNFEIAAGTKMVWK